MSIVESKVVARFAGREDHRTSVCLKLECGHINCFHGGGHGTQVGELFACWYCESGKPCPWTDADMQPYRPIGAASKFSA